MYVYIYIYILYIYIYNCNVKVKFPLFTIQHHSMKFYGVAWSYNSIFLNIRHRMTVRINHFPSHANNLQIFSFPP